MTIEIIGPSDCDLTLEHIRQFAAIRYKTFVCEMGWGLRHIAGLEFDQYDLPVTKYILAFRGSKIVGGLRLLPAQNNGGDSFMIGDMLAGRIPNVLHRHDMLEHVASDTCDAWEMSRFVALEKSVTRPLLNAAYEYLKGRGANICYTISPVLMARLLDRFGFDAEVISKKIECEGKQYVVIKTRVNATESGLKQAKVEKSVACLEAIA